MWRCEPCGASGEDHFEVCWRCGAPREGLVDEGESAPSPPEGPLPLPREEDGLTVAVKRCLACEAELDERGEMPLRVGGPEGGWSFFRELEEYGEKIWRVRVWACPSCRRLEFYEGE